MDKKTIVSYKKLALANFLNWFAMRLFRVTTIFCQSLIRGAMHLDPNRYIFKKNFSRLSKIQYTKLPNIKKPPLPFYSFAEGCKMLGQRIKFFDINQTVSLSLPKVINEDFKVSSEYQCEAALPDTYVAELDDATIFAGTDLVLVQDIVLYDEATRNEKYIYGIKSPYIDSITEDLITIKSPNNLRQTINCGIHFTKDHSINYFHWIIECLPRLSLVEGLSDLPLLVDDDLPTQFYEALEIANIDKRKIIKLKAGYSYRVKKLYYPSQLSIVHDNYKLPIYNKDAYYSPKAMNFLRNLVSQRLNINYSQPYRKIFLSRKNSDYRQLLNSVEIENLLISRGFEIVFPENLSFYAQVTLFSQAKIIAGQTGAGMANLIFAPKTCKILIMTSDASQTNLHLFNSLAGSVGISIDFIIGKGLLPSLHKQLTIHKDFYIDDKLIITYLENNL